MLNSQTCLAFLQSTSLILSLYVWCLFVPFILHVLSCWETENTYTNKVIYNGLQWEREAE